MEVYTMKPRKYTNTQAWLLKDLQIYGNQEKQGAILGKTARSLQKQGLVKIKKGNRQASLIYRKAR
jgi:hypothetical protein